MPNVVFVDVPPPVPAQHEAPNNVDNSIYYQAKTEDEDVFQDPVEPEDVKKENVQEEEADVFWTAESEPVSVAKLEGNALKESAVENMQDVMEKLDEDLHVITQMSNEIERAINASNSANQPANADHIEQIEILTIDQDTPAERNRNEPPVELMTEETREQDEFAVAEEMSVDQGNVAVTEEIGLEHAEMEVQIDETELINQEKSEEQAESENHGEVMSEFTSENQRSASSLSSNSASSQASFEEPNKSPAQDDDSIHLQKDQENEGEEVVPEQAASSPLPVVSSSGTDLEPNEENSQQAVLADEPNITEVTEAEPEAEFRGVEENTGEMLDERNEEIPIQEQGDDIAFVDADEDIAVADALKVEEGMADAPIAEGEISPAVPMAVEEDDEDLNDVEFADEEDEEIIAAEGDDLASVEEMPLSAEAFEQHVRGFSEDENILLDGDRAASAAQIISSRLNEVMTKETENLSPEVPTASYDVLTHHLLL